MSKAKGNNALFNKRPAAQKPATPAKKPSQVLSSKDQSNFRNAIKNYEAKQYKKGYKITEGILKNFPNNADTLALKALFLHHLNKNDEAIKNFKKAVENDPESSLAWQLYGIYFRNEKIYDESLKAFLNALQYDPQNMNIIRDLAPLLVQGKKYLESAVQKQKILEKNSGYRMYWTGLAVAYYLGGDYATAESTLDKFQSALKETIPKTDVENTEVLLFHNLTIYKQGDVQRALDHLEKISDNTCDPLGVMEYRAKYLLELGRHKDAEREYRALVKRNPDCRTYYESLESALKIDPSDTKTRIVLYQRLSYKYPRADVPKGIILSLTTGEQFKGELSKYVKSNILRGVPSTFVLVKPFYNDKEKLKIIEEVILDLEKEFSSETSIKPTAILWVKYFLAQHYNILGNISKSLEYIEQCLEDSPTMVEFFLTKARILKHAGDFKGAAKVLDDAREVDKSDRFVNSKTVKYFLRADEYSDAIKTASIFTRNDNTNVGIKDMNDMQILWVLIEQAETQYRLGHYSLSLKRFDSIFKVFFEYFTDQFDFHNYCIRKGTIRSYFELLDFEEKVYAHPIYLRALEGVSKICFKIDADRKKHQLALDTIKSIEDTQKKQEAQEALQKEEAIETEKKEKQLKELQEELKDIEASCTEAAKIRAANSPPKHNNNNHNSNKDAKPDSDPFGFELFDTVDPLEYLFNHWKKASEQAPASLSTWELGFEIYLRQQKYLLAIQTISSKLKGVTDTVPDHWVAQRAIRLRQAVISPPKTSPAPPAAVKVLLDRTLPTLYPGLKEATDLKSFYTEHVLGDKTSGSSNSAIYDWIEGLSDLESDEAKNKKSIEEVLFQKLQNKQNKYVTDFIKDLKILESIQSDRVTEYRQLAKKQWPLSTVF